MGKASKKYIEFKEDYLTHKKGKVLFVDYKTADRLVKQEVAGESTEKKYTAYHKKLAEAKAKAKADHIAKAKAEREAKAKENECKDCGDSDKPCKDCEEKEAKK